MHVFTAIISCIFIFAIHSKTQMIKIYGKKNFANLKCLTLVYKLFSYPDIVLTILLTTMSILISPLQIFNYRKIVLSKYIYISFCAVFNCRKKTTVKTYDRNRPSRQFKSLLTIIIISKCKEAKLLLKYMSLV